MTKVTTKNGLSKEKIVEAVIIGLNTTATIVANLAFDIAPKDTGYLASTIEVIPAEQTSDGIYTAQIKVSAEYAKFVEYGTDKQIAQPFLRPAMQANYDTLNSELKKEINGVFS